MTFKTKVIFLSVSLFCLTVGLGTIYLVCQKVFSMPFRTTNDTLHQHGGVVTLDFLIPAGTYIDEKMTIGDVVRIRFEKPKGRLNKIVHSISENIPLKYRLVGTLALYLFWTFLFLVFFRIFTWIRYVGALSLSFLAGALVYFFMPDLVMGRADDAVFCGWAMAFVIMVRWYSKRMEFKH